MGKNKYFERDQAIYLGYRRLRDEGFTRDRAIEVLKNSDYGHLSRSYLKQIIKTFNRKYRKKGKYIAKIGDKTHNI